MQVTDERLAVLCDWAERIDDHEKNAVCAELQQRRAADAKLDRLIAKLRLHTNAGSNAGAHGLANECLRIIDAPSPSAGSEAGG